MKDTMTQLSTGETAPDFTLPTPDGGEVSLGPLRQQADRGVIVYFYPKAATPGCTTQACDFRDNLASLGALGYSVVGISADPVEDLRAFAAEQSLSFPLGSDTEHAVAEAYGTWGPKTLNGQQMVGVHRSTFVIDTDGTIVLAEDDDDAKGHVAALRAQLAG